MRAEFSGLRWLLERRDKWRLVAVACLMVVAAMLETIGIGAVPLYVALLAAPDKFMAMPIVGSLVNAIGVPDAERFALWMASGLVAVFVVKNTYTVWLTYLQGQLFRNLIQKLAHRLFHAYMHAPYPFHLGRNPAFLMRNINGEVSQAIESGLKPLLVLVRESLVMLLVFGLLLAVDPVVSLSVLGVLGGASLVFQLAIRQRLRNFGLQAQAERGLVGKATHQGLFAVKEAKLFGREDHLIRVFDRHFSILQRLELFREFMSALPRPVLELVALVGLVIVAGTYLGQGRSFAELLPYLALMAAATVRLIPGFNQIATAFAQLQYGGVSVSLVVNELRTVEAQAAPLRSQRTTAELHFRRSLELQSVAYRYPNASDDSLRGVSLSIGFGEAVAFVGSTGAGKTTAIDLILGLLPPTKGKVLADGVDIQENPRAWQDRIGYVPQDINLLDESIRRNIAFGLPDEAISASQVQRALEAAQLGALVASLPEGINTVIGNRGVRLSGGQRQRIGIARALYHDPEVLVLDEATSALDNATEFDLMQAINALRGSRTIIMIAHRLSTVAHCDRVFQLADGLLVDLGTYEELVARNPSFRTSAGLADKHSGSDDDGH